MLNIRILRISNFYVDKKYTSPTKECNYERGLPEDRRRHMGLWGTCDVDTSASNFVVGGSLFTDLIKECGGLV